MVPGEACEQSCWESSTDKRLTNKEKRELISDGFDLCLSLILEFVTSYPAEHGSSIFYFHLSFFCTNANSEEKILSDVWCQCKHEKLVLDLLAASAFGNQDQRQQIIRYEQKLCVTAIPDGIEDQLWKIGSQLNLPPRPKSAAVILNWFLLLLIRIYQF